MTDMTDMTDRNDRNDRTDMTDMNDSPNPTTSTSSWFHVADSSAPLRLGEVRPLDPQEARHAVGARRLRDGDSIALFDGRGNVATARLMQRGEGAAIEAVHHQPPPTPRVVVASAIPKGDRASTLIDMATQLGMAAFVPLRCARSVVEMTDASRTRLERIAIESCKQSRRAWVPPVLDELSPVDAVRFALAAESAAILLDPAGPPLRTLASELSRARIALLIGPEGGFTDDERTAMIAAGAVTASIGDGILRIEAAAVVGLALVRSCSSAP